MYGPFTISLTVCWAVTVYLLYTATRCRMELHKVRLKMQEQGTIDAEAKIRVLTLRGIVFWMLPVRKYTDLNNDRHNRLAKRVNGSLLGILAVVAVFGILMTVFR